MPRLPAACKTFSFPAAGAGGCWDPPPVASLPLPARARHCACLLPTLEHFIPASALPAARALLPPPASTPATSVRAATYHMTRCLPLPVVLPPCRAGATTTTWCPALPAPAICSQHCALPHLPRPAPTPQALPQHRCHPLHTSQFHLLLPASINLPAPAFSFCPPAYFRFIFLAPLPRGLLAARRSVDTHHHRARAFTLPTSPPRLSGRLPTSRLRCMLPNNTIWFLYSGR